MKMTTHRTWIIVTFLSVIFIDVHGTIFSVPVKQEDVFQKMPLEMLRTEILDLINKHDESGKTFTRDSINDIIPALPHFQNSPALVPKVPAQISQSPESFLLSDVKAKASLLKGGLVDPIEIPAKDFIPPNMQTKPNTFERKNEKLKLPVVNSLMQTLSKIRQINKTRTGNFKNLSAPLNTMLSKKFFIKGAKCTSKRCKSLMNKASKPKCKGTNLNQKKKETVPKKQNLLQTLRSLSLSTRHIKVTCAGFDPRMALTNTFPRRNPLLVKSKSYEKN
ncbi:hypothetical protein CHS0354_009168 [Potamilus streckersoni]|uniref:Uncharacterized protein n=1 Tax=Potamilus streckersoni TaxID=2493646 RepID=A0AAE0RYZ1_9BIVA|nr:hypothetical protein CHS0354_009168 [Potamilus streckersoni]